MLVRQGRQPPRTLPLQADRGVAVSCPAMLGPDGTPRGFECGLPTRIRYPGGDPENGPARQYCADGHSTCYSCGRVFQAITRTEAWTDEETGMQIEASTHESDWCRQCEDEHRRTHCGCGQDVELHEHRSDDGDDVWKCCGGFMCCSTAEE